MELGSSTLGTILDVLDLAFWVRLVFGGDTTGTVSTGVDTTGTVGTGVATTGTETPQCFNLICKGC